MLALLLSPFTTVVAGSLRLAAASHLEFVLVCRPNVAILARSAASPSERSPFARLFGRKLCSSQLSRVPLLAVWACDGLLIAIGLKPWRDDPEAPPRDQMG